MAKPKRSAAGTTTPSPPKKQQPRKKKRRVDEEENGDEAISPTTSITEGETEEVPTEEPDVVSLPTVVSRPAAVHRDDLDCRFLGQPISDDEARSRWPNRYNQQKKQYRGKVVKNDDDEEDEIKPAKRHYRQAEVDGQHIFNLNDDAHVAAEKGKKPYICKIVELFEGEDGLPYFRAQWYYRAEDTVIKDTITLKEEKRIFPSDVQNDNLLDCLLEKITVVRVKPNLDVTAKLAEVPQCEYYYDMMYLLPYTTFKVPPEETVIGASDSESSLCSEIDTDDMKTENDGDRAAVSQRPDMTLLDLYCGCGAMSTGLCAGASLCGINLVTKWAVDFNKHACDTVMLNHSETQVRNESVENFLLLLKEWKKLCASCGLIENEETHAVIDRMALDNDSEEEEEEETDGDASNDPEVFEVEQIMGICFGDPKEIGQNGLYFLVRWKGYGPDDDTWEPVEGLGDCFDCVKAFVKKGFEDKLFPLPGDVDIVCGGPPCQGISGFNRFRQLNNPLADEKNKQLLVYMAVVEYLQPKYVLMENVVDLVKMAKGYLGRYALGKLVDMNYQARMGMMAAGAYGLPQFRMRVFIWGAQPSQKLTPYPLPTHDVLVRGVIPVEFERNTVAYDVGHSVKLLNKLFLGDAISDLPKVENHEPRDVMPYDKLPETDFQRFIRMTKDAMAGKGTELSTQLFDHRPLKLNADDLQRVCRIPKRKGANFRDLPGVRIRPDNKVEFDPDVPRVLLPSNKPLVPTYAVKFCRGTSSKPFGRLWYDETVPTVVTRAEPHNQIICHPFQDRVLTIRENARLQGFPDHYQLTGPIKQRYMQVGNAVAVPVARALGYALALAVQGSVSDDPLVQLPQGFPMNGLPEPSVELQDQHDGTEV